MRAVSFALAFQLVSEPAGAVERKEEEEDGDDGGSDGEENGKRGDSK